MDPRRGLAALKARPRLVAVAALVVVVALVLPSSMRLSTRLLAAWDLGIVIYLALLARMMATTTYQVLQRRADEEDAGAVAVLILSVVAATASLVAIGAELHGIKEASDKAMAGERLAMAGATILLSWLFVHTMFAVHYAHDFYAGEEDRRGLDFPKTERPDYWDFLYFAANLGAAAQTSDVQVTAARMRRFVLAHTILSFLFNTTILALAINVGASLL